MMLPSTELPRSVPGGTDKGNPMKIWKKNIVMRKGGVGQDGPHLFFF
jgi:hypothetical protein